MKKSLLFFGFFFIYLVQSFGQCTGQPYFRDGDGDTYGGNFDTLDIANADQKFRAAGDGVTVYEGNIAFGCTKPSGYSTNANDCNDSDPDVWSTATWYTDEDGDGAHGTRHSGCQTPPSDSSTTVRFQTLPFDKIILL